MRSALLTVSSLVLSLAAVAAVGYVSFVLGFIACLTGPIAPGSLREIACSPAGGRFAFFHYPIVIGSLGAVVIVGQVVTGRRVQRTVGVVCGILIGLGLVLNLLPD